MVTTDVELELTQQLKEAGRQLSNLPDSVDELLHLLDQTEKLLSMVDQTPNNLMLEAFTPATKALVDESLLKHSNMDVKVAVAACLCELTRITAPDAPYNDEEMKGVFQLIVSSLENLSDKASRSYDKRVSILDTVSKVRSCVIMLDLECEDLIVKMFDHFLKSIRDSHGDNIFSSMMNIMAVVLEESEDISVDMLKPLLATLKNNTEGVLPVARKLGEGVLQRAADKIKPYITKTLISLDDSLDKYSQVLACICEETTDVVEHDDKDSSKKPEEAVDHPDPNPTSMVESRPDQTSESGEKKTGSPLESADKNTDIPVSVAQVIESEVADSPSRGGGLPDKSYVKTDDLPMEAEAANVGAKSQSRSIPYKKRTKRAGRSKNKSLSQDDAPPMDVVLTKSPKRAIKKASFAQEDKLPATITAMKDSKPTSDSDTKHLKTPSKKVDTVDSDAKHLKMPSKKVDAVDSGSKPTKRYGKKVGAAAKKPKVSGKKTDVGDSEANKSHAAMNENESDSDSKPLIQCIRRAVTKRREGSDSATEPLKLSAKKAKNSSSALVKSSAMNKDGKKDESGKNVEEKDQTKSLPEENEIDISPKSAVKTATEEDKVEEALVTTSKRKRAVGKNKVTDTIKYDDSLVDLKVKVWWPKDKMYYEGVIKSFDSVKKKHKVLYLDGEAEMLNLRTQKWEILQTFSAHNEEKAADVQSPDVLPETSRPKKKSKDSTKGGGGASLSSKSKDSAKGEEKAKDVSIFGDDSKEAGKSKEDDEEISKTIPEKHVTPIVYKSRRKSPESENTANANDSMKPKSVSVNAKESEDADAGETRESPKGKPAEKMSGSKGRKKRKKRT